jgi:uncharacterized membrane protein YfbV (UPF0208 family)
MNISVVQLIKLGQKYLSLWPEKAELANYFADYRAVQSARFVCRYFPALALFTVLMQLYFASGLFLGQEGFGRGAVDKAFLALPQALVYGAFLLSLPIQALVVSGVKADKLLPPALASWYRSGLEKAKQQAINSAAAESNYQGKKNHSKSSTASNEINNLAVYKPRYIDLAQLLQLTFAAKN